MDGDDIDDLAVGAYFYSDGTTAVGGALAVYLGGRAGPSLLPDATLFGPEYRSYFAHSLAAAGDVNADGYADVIAAGPEYNGWDGMAWLFLGSPTGLDAANPTIFYPPTEEGLFGYGLTGLGDCNHDGYDDVAIGSEFAEHGTGRVDVYFGDSTGQMASGTVTVLGEDNTEFGNQLSNAGDTDGDGYNELVVGLRLLNTSRLYPCSAAGFDTEPSWEADQYSGGSDTSGAGDVNGDGYADFVVGSNNFRSAYVYGGAATGAPTAPLVTIEGDALEQFGLVVAGGGDLDADGYDDVVVSACEHRDFTGIVQIFYGSAAGPSATPDANIPGPNPNSRFGDALSISGDLDADGYDDLIIGASYWNGGDGLVSIAYGAPRDLDGDGAAADIDCDDADPSRFPAALEQCDGVDQDCDGLIDEGASDAPPWFADGDGDGYGGAPVAVPVCVQPEGFVADGTDCDDLLADVHPGAVEVCDPARLDQDCDGLSDDDDPDVDPATFPSWYADADGDTYGDEAALTLSCAAPPGGLGRAGDCDDHHPAVHPGAVEVCDPADTDEDCDGLADDADPDVDLATLLPWYADLDGDTYGDEAELTLACAAPPGSLDHAGDCDDRRADVHPGGLEVCDPDDTDEDCNGVADDHDPGVDRASQSTTYADADADTYGDPALPQRDCTPPAGSVQDNTDCDDGSAAVHPGAIEVCDPASTDEDCNTLADDADPGVDPDTQTVWYPDADHDRYGAAGAASSSCHPPAGTTPDGADCDDANADVHPGAPEECANGLDDDCDLGTTDTCPAEEDTAGQPKPSCGCASGTGSEPSGSLPFWGLLFSIGLLTRRRR